MVSLATKVVRGGFWVLALRIFSQLLLSAKLVILARLLSPQDFGMMGIVLIAISMLESFSVTGVDTALICEKGEIRCYLDTAWTMSILRGMSLSLIAFVSASYIGWFFGIPSAVVLLKVSSLFFLVRGFANSAVVYFPREMNFKKQFLLGLAQVLADLIVSITFAFLLKNAWALVYGFLSGALANTVASFALHPYRPGLRINLRRVRDLLGFGRWVWGSNILIFIGSRMDGIVVGKVLGTAPLGFYQMGLNISRYFTREISETISQVVFPAYASLQEDKVKLHKSFLTTTRMTFAIIFPLALILVFYAKEIVSLVLGKQWIPLVPALRLLALAGLLRGIAGLGGWLFYAVGHPKWNFVMTTARTAVLFFLLIPLTILQGLSGAAMAVLMANAALLLPLLILLSKASAIKVSEYFKALDVPFLLGFPLIGLSYGFSEFLAKGYNWLPLIWAAVGMSIYGLATAYTERDMLRLIWSKVVAAE
jgi:lipopolysaccharide exporter